MLAELRQMGPEGRRRVVEIWSNHVPDYVYQSTVDTPQVDPASHIAADEVGDRASAASDELLANFPSTANLSNEVGLGLCSSHVIKISLATISRFF